MISVNEVLQLSLFDDSRIICGSEYLENSIIGAVILEYESSAKDYAGYCYGEFVLVSYFMAKSNPELVHDSLVSIIKKHVSGIAIKLPEGETLPDDILLLAKKNHVPIIAFYAAFMEDLIVSITNSLKDRAQVVRCEELLGSIIANEPDREKVKDAALEINYAFKPYIVSAAVTFRNVTDKDEVRGYFTKMMYHQFRIEDTTSYAYVRYRNEIVLICSYNEEDKTMSRLDVRRRMTDILTNAGISMDAIQMGICDNVLRLDEMNISVTRAVNANTACRYLDKSIQEYSTMGIYKYITATSNDTAIYHDIIKKIDILKNYDNDHESVLIETLKEFYQNNENYAAASAKLYQHTNTIRYRIKKTMQLLAEEGEEEMSEDELAILIRSYLLHEIAYS